MKSLSDLILYILFIGLKKPTPERGFGVRSKPIRKKVFLSKYGHKTAIGECLLAAAPPIAAAATAATKPENQANFRNHGIKVPLSIVSHC